MRTRFLPVIGLITCLSACSPDLIKVSKSRLLAARSAEKPVEKGPAAPGAFQKVLRFDSPVGFLTDPNIEITQGMARLRPGYKKPEVQGAKEPMIVTTIGMPFRFLHGFEETSAPGSEGLIKYQLSFNGMKWFYFNGTKWTPALTQSTDANTATEVNAHIAKFDTEAGSGSLFVRAFFVPSSDKKPVALKQVTIGGVLPEVDAWD